KVELTTPLKELGVRLLAFSAVGAPRDSIEELHAQLQQQIRAVGAPLLRSRMREALVDHATILLPLGWGDKLWNPEPKPEVWRNDFRTVAKQGNKDRLRQMVDSSLMDFNSTTVWRWTPEYSLFNFAVRVAQQGDTAQTVHQLDLLLNSMEGMPAYF